MLIQILFSSSVLQSPLMCFECCQICDGKGASFFVKATLSIHLFAGWALGFTGLKTIRMSRYPAKYPVQFNCSTKKLKKKGRTTRFRLFSF